MEKKIPQKNTIKPKNEGLVPSSIFLFSKLFSTLFKKRVKGLYRLRHWVQSLYPVLGKQRNKKRVGTAVRNTMVHTVYKKFFYMAFVKKKYLLVKNIV